MTRVVSLSTFWLRDWVISHQLLTPFHSVANLSQSTTWKTMSITMTGNKSMLPVLTPLHNWLLWLSLHSPNKAQVFREPVSMLLFYNRLIPMRVILRSMGERNIHFNKNDNNHGTSCSQIKQKNVHFQYFQLSTFSPHHGNFLMTERRLLE